MIRLPFFPRASRSPACCGRPLFQSGRAPWRGVCLGAVLPAVHGCEGITDALLLAGEQAAPGWAVAAVLAAAVLLLAVVVWRLEGRLHREEKSRETDPATGFLTEEALARRFPRLVTEADRDRYCLVCFHFELGHIERLGGREEALRFLRFGAGLVNRLAWPEDLPAVTPGGDFLILKKGGPEAVAAWGRTVLEKLRTFPYAGGRLRTDDAAVGIYPLGADRFDWETIRFHAKQCALTACRGWQDAKICGGAACLACLEERQLLGDLDDALAGEEISLYLQFFVDGETFRVVGGEALSRWVHPTMGELNPQRFIPLLEREGRIHQLDFYSLEKSCAFLEELGRRQVRDFFISCNFSRRTFAAKDFASRCKMVLGRYEFPHRLLILEITESQMESPQDYDQMLRNIMEIRALGVRIMFDDFGMGYSSFHDLQEYPMDGLKLDKELVERMDTHRGRVILSGLVRTGHDLGLTILAEGVETDRQVQALQQLHCDVLQGFRFSVPIPAGQAMEAILARDPLPPGED